ANRSTNEDIHLPLALVITNFGSNRSLSACISLPSCILAPLYSHEEEEEEWLRLITPTLEAPVDVIDEETIDKQTGKCSYLRRFRKESSSEDVDVDEEEEMNAAFIIALEIDDEEDEENDREVEMIMNSAK
ncbi:hypothetical protein PMAYCL1PPCAC_31507, partial [Pristionchus mayeri]